MRTELSVALLNPEGKLLKEIKHPSRSFVLQFIGLLFVLHTNTDLSMKDISNTARTVRAACSWSTFKMAAGGGGILELLTGYQPPSASADATTVVGDSLGIQVGSGSTAPTPTNYAMQTRITHGQAAGQLVYGGCEVEPPVISAPNATMLIRRYLTNKSGGNVTIWEVGLYAVGMTEGATAYVFLTCRDVLGAPITVANTELLRVQYAIQVTV